MHNANQIHEFIKLVYQDKLNWLWIIVNKVILFPPTPENVIFVFKCSDKKPPVFNNKHKFSCTRHSIHGCDFIFISHAQLHMLIC